MLGESRDESMMSKKSVFSAPWTVQFDFGWRGFAVSFTISDEQFEEIARSHALSVEMRSRLAN
jgi:hypothetical protein